MTGDIVYHAPVGGQELISFIARESVSCFGGRGVPYVGNGCHFCKTVLMNKSNITFKVARLSTCGLKKCSEKRVLTIICMIRA